MRRLAAVLFPLAFATLAPAAVVERVSPVVDVAIGSPLPVLSPAVAPSLSASFAPALLPSLPSPALSLKPVATPVAVVAALPLTASAALPRERGPPTARDAEYGAAVAHGVAAKAQDWGVPSAEILENHDAILVGESHHSLASVGELAKALPGLAAAGVKVLGIEGLKRPSQDAVDAYLARRAALPPEVLAFSPRRRAAFEGLFEAAREAGVRIIALGVPLDAWAKQTAELAAAKTGDPMESFLAAPGEQLYRAQTSYEPGYNEAVAEVYVARRNASMAAFLVESMVRGAKAVVLVGQNHVEGADDIPSSLMRAPGNWGSMGRELARWGLKAFSLTLTGGLYVDADGAADDRAARPAAYAAAAKAAPDGGRAFKRSGPDKGLYHAGGTVPSGSFRARR
ncbi:MAG: ChaN family lipoprotein [Elusimicrobia bacterium]|nr:ChaN family lipoprotein [Elusimicrobiota bacterium]